MPLIHNTLAIRRGQTQGHPNPYAQGHFDAFNFVFQTLVGSTDFPCKDSLLLTNEYNSDNALYWLRELHTLIMYPIASQSTSLGIGLESTTIKPHECGTYRIYPKTLAFCQAPNPEQIKPLLHLWITDLTNYHESIKDKIGNLLSFSRDEADTLYRKTEEANLFLSCLQPFQDGNNRVARLVENALRLQWGIPWKNYPKSEHNKFVQTLGTYQLNGFQDWVRKLT
jgi:hypothetical protein